MSGRLRSKFRRERASSVQRPNIEAINPRGSKSTPTLPNRAAESLARRLETFELQFKTHDRNVPVDGPKCIVSNLRNTLLSIVNIAIGHQSIYFTLKMILGPPHSSRSLIRAIVVKSFSVRHDRRIDTALELLAQVDEAITVSQLAAAVGLSPSRFSHLFVQRTGVLPGKHLRLLKRFRSDQQRLAQDSRGELAGPLLDVKAPEHGDSTQFPMA